MADLLFFQDLFTDNTKMPKIGCRRSHYGGRLRLKIISYQRSDHLILFIAHGTAKNKFLSFPIFKQSHPITVHIM